MAAVNSIGASRTEAKAVEGLASSNPRVRESSVRVAGYFGFEHCAETLLAALDDSDESVRRAAIEQLPLRGDLVGVSALEKALHEESARNRAAAAHAFKMIEGADAEAALVLALQDADPWVRYFAADALCVHGRAVAINALQSVAEDDPATHVRIAALRALSALHAPTSHAIARGLLESGEDDLTSAALAALADATETDTDDILAEHACGSRPAVRLAAIEVLGRRGTDRAVTALADAARLPVTPPLGDDAIRALTTAAGRPGTAQRRAVEALMTLGIDDELRPLVIDGCAAMPASAIAWLREPLGSPDPAVRRLAIDCLARLRHPAASDAILTALGDPDVAVRTAALNAVSRLGPLTAAGAVAALAQCDPDTSIRRRASAACERHGWNEPRRESES
jgi:HEAT repeat protein